MGLCEHARCTQFMQDAQEVMDLLLKVQMQQGEMEADDPQVRGGIVSWGGGGGGVLISFHPGRGRGIFVLREEPKGVFYFATTATSFAITFHPFLYLSPVSSLSLPLSLCLDRYPT